MNNTRDTHKKIILTHVVFIGIIFLCGCASIVGYTKLYSDPEKPLSEIAILTQPNPYLQEIVILKIDNNDAQFAGLTELLPGQHKVTALYYDSDGGRSRMPYTRYYKAGTASLQFHADAGHVYEIFPVLHTHDNGWYLSIWDVTDELNRPEKQKLSQRIDEILKKNRISNALISANNQQIAGKTMEKLPGFGEKIKARIIGMKGKQVDVEYAFDRYNPFILVEGSDGADYHLKISQLNGSVEEVLGIRVFAHGDAAFQPINSDTAYVYNSYSGKIEDIMRTYKEMPDGSYNRIK